MEKNKITLLKTAVVGSVLSVAMSGCVSPYEMPFPGGADTGDKPYNITVQFRDVLDLVPQSGVRVNEIPVGKVKKIRLNGWTAVVELELNRNAELPDNAEATIRQTSLLGEKFVDLAPPESGAVGKLGEGDMIPLERSGRNPEIEEVLGAASLLFNGGGLEKTKTVVQELNKTLDGNETEIKQLLRSANSFVTQLDNNKEALLTSLEKVNRLAIETNKQKGAITGALDNLPAALRTLDDQRDDLVKLLESLNRLGDVGTEVVAESKADTVANLKALVPILRNLKESGDDLPETLTALLTFPFPDGSVGGPTLQGVKDYHKGDYTNLNASLEMTLGQLTELLGLGTLPLSGEQASGPLAGLLPDLIGGLIPDLTGGLPPLPGVEGLLPGAPKPGQGSTPTPTTPTTSESQGGLCSLLGQCRIAPASPDKIAGPDLGRLLIEPLVAS